MKILLLLPALLFTVPAFAGEPGPGKTVQVECKANPAQKYSCYVPKAYSPKKAWPILYCFAPDANGAVFVQRYKKACEERGWIVVGSLNSQNGPWEPIKEAIDAMWTDTEQRFNLSPKMRYASGFSGGSRVSFGLAEMKPEFFAGVIGIGAGLSSTNTGLPKKDLAIWLMCGETDFNLNEMTQLHGRLKESGHTVEFRRFPGGHTLPETSLMGEAVRWMDDQSSTRKTEKFTAAIAAAKSQAEAGEHVEAWLGLGEALQKYADVKEGRSEAEKLKKSLERNDSVKPEVKALAKYEKAVAWVEKNRSRIEKSRSARAQAEKKFNEIVEKYAGTRGAALAEAGLAALAGGGE